MVAVRGREWNPRKRAVSVDICGRSVHLQVGTRVSSQRRSFSSEVGRGKFRRQSGIGPEAIDRGTET